MDATGEKELGDVCWRCDHPDATFHDYLDHMQDEIMGHGVVVEHVEHVERPLAYTIGLSDHGAPELMMTGLDGEISHRVLHSVAHQIIDDGARLEPAMLIAYPDRFLIEVVEVDHPEVHLDFAIRLCGSGIRAMQLVWSDDRGRWPCERGWGHGRRRQPVLGRRANPWR
jgi:hypothetical protein